MPHSIENEQSVLGSMIMSAEAIGTAVELLTPDDFYARQNGIIFSCITDLETKGKAVDPVTLIARMQEKQLPPEVCTPEFIAGLVERVPTSTNIRTYCEIVRQKSVLRKLIRTCEEIANKGYTKQDELDAILEEAQKRVFDLSAGSAGSTFVPIEQIVMRALGRIDEASKSDSPITGVPTGFIDLDSALAGLQKSDFILIAARPSMGKTALALNMAEYAAMHDMRHVAVFSLEMSKEQLVNRLFAMESHVDAQKIRIGDLSAAEWVDLLKSADEIARSNLMIDDTSAITVAELRTKCRKFKAEQGLDLVVIDYLQLMTGTARGNSEQSRQQEISDISRQLKALARELDVPVIALSQLSRAVESRPNKRPMLSDLRESGAIEQDADVVMFIYRDDYYNHDSEKKGIAEIIIAKQRNGPIGTVELQWIPQWTQFKNLPKGNMRQQDAS